MTQNYLLEIGDKVRINNPYQPFLNGKEGVIKQFGEHIIRRGVYDKHIKPGVYVNKSDMFLVLKDSNVVVNARNDLIGLVDTELEKIRKANVPKNIRESTQFSHGSFLRDLSETQFYEGDEVEVYSLHPSLRDLIESHLRIDNIPQFCNKHGINKNELIVVGIDYYAERRANYPHYQQYTVSDGASKHRIKVLEFQLALKERGNLWKALHNEQVNFKNLAEEVSLNLMLGQYEYVLTPEDNFGWEKEAAWKCIRETKADGFRLDALTPDPTNLLGDGTLELIVYEDRRLGERVRTATLAQKKGV